MNEDDRGFTLWAHPGSLIRGPVSLQGVRDVTLQRLTLNSTLTIDGGISSVVREGILRGTVSVIGGNGVRLVDNDLQSNLLVSQNADNTRVEFNRWQLSGGTAISLNSAAHLVLSKNRSLAAEVGIEVTGPVEGDGSRKRGFADRNRSVDRAGFYRHHRPESCLAERIGARLSRRRGASGQSIPREQRRSRRSVRSALTGLGFAAGSSPNLFAGNRLGVRLTGAMQNQLVQNNDVGVTGAGILGGTDLSLANRFEGNLLGADFDGTVQFNRFARNRVAIAAHDNQLIDHNVLVLNQDQGILLAGKDRVTIQFNTFLSDSGDNIRLIHGSTAVEITNNLLSSSGAYNIYVDDTSQQGYFSDFNTLHATGSAKLVHWYTDFTDILDWQVDLNEFDLHSFGTTIVNPLWAIPRFTGRFEEDWRLITPLAGQRLSSPAARGSDPRNDLAWGSMDNNLLRNASFEDGLANWTTNSSASTANGPTDPFQGSSYFRAGVTDAIGTAQQSVDLMAAGFTATQLDSLNLTIAFGGRVRVQNADPGNEPRIEVDFLRQNGDVIATRSALSSQQTARWELVGDHVPLPFGTRVVRYRLVAPHRSGSSQEVYLDHARIVLFQDDAITDQGASARSISQVSGQGTAQLVLRTPDLYTDWERDRPQTIFWNSFGNTTNSPLKIDLYQDGFQGPQLVRTLTASIDDTGEFTWIPANFGVNYGTHGWRIHISLVQNPAVYDRSTEPYSVPENTTTFYVNDSSLLGDQYTSAPGSNRRTGKAASSPKPSLANLLRTYRVGATHTVFIDSGEYRLFAPIILSGNGVVGDDEGMTITGPTAKEHEALAASL